MSVIRLYSSCQGGLYGFLSHAIVISDDSDVDPVMTSHKSLTLGYPERGTDFIEREFVVKSSTTKEFFVKYILPVNPSLGGFLIPAFCCIV